MRVVIGEDLFLLREGLVRLLTAHGFEIVAAVASAPELLQALVDERPDVGIVDVRLPPTHTDDGLRAALQARGQVPGLPVLVLSQYVEQLYARELLADRAGAVGYLLKDRVFNDDQFTGAIRTVAAGGTVLDPEVVQKLMVRHSRTEPVARLTPREREVLALMAEGRSNAAIAQRLFVTEKAVSKHAAGIFAKLDLAPSDDDNRRVLAVLAYLDAPMKPELRQAAEAAIGFMPAAEGLALYAAAARYARRGPVLEVGSYCGKSTIYLAAATREAGQLVVTVDHHRGSEEHQPGWEYHDPDLVDPASAAWTRCPGCGPRWPRPGSRTTWWSW